MTDRQKGMQMTEQAANEPYVEPNTQTASTPNNDPNLETNAQNFGHSARGNADQQPANEDEQQQ
jgi:hypothetical protein